MDWRKYADAIASIESAGSGGYSAIGPRHPSLGRALGRYQIMEANLAPWGQEALGRAVTPDEFLSNPDIQDTLFQHKFGGYVNQYGPEGAAQAWFAGPGGVGKTGRKDSLGTSVGAYTDKFNRAMGGGGSATMTGSAGNDTLGVPMQDEQQQPQNFWQRIRERPEMMMAIGGALQNLGWRGSGDDTMRAANAMLLGRSAEAKAQKQQTRTAQWLAQMGRADLAEAVASGALDGRSAVALAYQKPENDQTSAMQNYQFLLAQGVDPETAMGRAFSGGTTVNVGGDSAAPDSVLRETMQKKEGESLNKLSDAGNKAAGVMRDLQLLRELSAQAPEGPIQGQLAEMFPQYNDIAALRQAIVKRVAPTLRVEGSGSTSDIEYSGMIEGLGRLPNSREVNVAIADAMIQKAELDIRRSEIIGQYQRGEIEYNQMQSAIEQLNRQFKVPDGIAQILSSNQPSAAGGDYQVIDGVQIRRRN